MDSIALVVRMRIQGNKPQKVKISVDDAELAGLKKEAKDDPQDSITVSVPLDGGVGEKDFILVGIVSVPPPQFFKSRPPVGKMPP